MARIADAPCQPSVRRQKRRMVSAFFVPLAILASATGNCDKAYTTPFPPTGLPIPVQEEKPSSNESGGDEIVATIDGNLLIRRREVEQLVRAIADEAPISPALRQSLHEQALRQLVGQRLILAYLGSQKRASTETDIDLYVDQLRSRLEQQNVEWGPFLEDLGVTETEFRTSVRWKLSWENYLAEHLTEKNLQRFFEQNQADFDGTEVEVSQVLFKIKPTDDAKQVERLVVRMKELKAKIESNSVTFVEAARSDSEAASGPEGGSLGRIKRYGAMPESFSKAAFALAAGEISDPVTTNIGVHLIRCDRVIKGELQFEQVRAAVRRSATQYLFDWLVEKAKENHTVKYPSKVGDSNEK